VELHVATQEYEEQRQGGHQIYKEQVRRDAPLFYSVRCGE